MEETCEYFAWDCDWYYCTLQEKEIEPKKCETCKQSKLKKIVSKLVLSV